MHDWFPEKPILRDRLFYSPTPKVRNACGTASGSSSGSQFALTCLRRTPSVPRRMALPFALIEGAAFVLCYTSPVLAGANPACKLLN